MEVVVLMLLFLLAVLSIYLVARRSDQRPPAIGSYIPLIGCAVQFGRDPIQFIHQCQDKYGKIFTLCLPGQRLTFLLDASHYDQYYSTNCVDFQAAVQPTCQKTANITKSAFIDSHSKLHDLVKGRLSSSYLQVLSIKLSHKFYQQSQQFSKTVTNIELMDIVKILMFKPVLECMFGDDVLFMNESECDDLWQQLKLFDADFELGAQIPELFLGKWSRSKRWLLNKFDNAVRKVQEIAMDEDNSSKTIFQSLLSTVRKDAASNFGLLFFWATQANAIPAVYWTLFNICQDQRVYDKVMKELHSVWPSPEEEIIVREDDVKRLPYIKWCILEAVRLQSPGISSPRIVVKPIKFQDFIIPPGDMMVISPYWSHRDPVYFTEPEKYYPERWLQIQDTKKSFMDGFVAFGGGRYQCPGRWFAIMEMQLFISLLLLNYKIEFTDVKPQKPTRLVGLQHPTSTCLATLSKRKV